MSRSRVQVPLSAGKNIFEVNIFLQYEDAEKSKK